MTRAKSGEDKNTEMDEEEDVGKMVIVDSSGRSRRQNPLWVINSWIMIFGILTVKDLGLLLLTKQPCLTYI